MSKTIWSPRLPKDGAPIYRAIADAIERDLTAGVLRPGSRLPTHRHLAEHLGITTLTVTRAYNEAARRGLVESSVGRGTFVRSSASTDEPRKPLDLSRNIITGSEDLELRRELVPDLRKLLRSPEYQTPAGGAPRHKAAGAAWLSRFGVDAAADRVLVVPGAQHALTVLLATLLAPGDTLLVEPLTYPALRPLLNLLRLRVHTIALDDEGIQPRALDRACKTGPGRVLYCVPTFQNPTAVVMSAERRREIAAVAKRHGVLIIEDDSYGFLLPGTKPIAALLPESTCYISSTSKSISPSLRVGFISPPADLVPRLDAAIYSTVSFTSTLSAEIFTNLLESGEGDRVIARKRALISEHQKLARGIFGTRVGATHPASPHLFLQLGEEWDAQEFAQQTAAAGVAVTPAASFAHERGALPNAVRVSLGATAATAELRNALQMLQRIASDARLRATPVM